MNINMTIDSEFLIDAAARMPVNEKLKLYERIKDDIIQYRVEEILNSSKTDDISEEEITEIAEHVRSERFKNRR